MSHVISFSCTRAARKHFDVFLNHSLVKIVGSYDEISLLPLKKTLLKGV